MNSKKKWDLYWPTHEQELLLRASLLQGENALNAWYQWRETVDIECLDSESYHLLGLLYRNLSIHEVKDSYTTKLKGVYRSMWYKNKLILQEVSVILRSFYDAGIEILVLKDAAIVSHYYQDYRLRPMFTLDFLIRPVDTEATMSLLKKLGWIPEIKREKKLVSLSPTLRFRSKSTNQLLILHKYIFRSSLQKNDSNVWNNTTLTKIGDFSPQILSPTDQLLHICLHEFRWHSGPQIRWIADAIIINLSAVKIDWSLMITQAQQYRLVLPLKNMLTLLHENLGVAIPLSVLQTIQSTPVSPFEHLENQVFNRIPPAVSRQTQLNVICHKPPSP